MEKKKLNLHLASENYFNYNDNWFSIDFDSLESLKLALSDFSKFVDYKEYLDKEEDIARISSETYYIDSEGNELETFDFDDDDYKIVSREPEEAEKMINEILEDAKSAYKDMLDKNYEIDTFALYANNNATIDEIKEIIDFLKDKIKVLDISVLNLVDVINILKDIDIEDKVKIITKYSYNDSSNKTELLELSSYLDNIKNLVTRYELSPLETCILVSDLLVEREYKLAEADKDVFKGDKVVVEEIGKTANSRSITKVFQSDEIVCAGFSNLYSAILELVGINSDTISYAPIKGSAGHMSNVVYLNDKKYSVKGLFEIDTTWRRRKDKNKKYDYQKTLFNYQEFARSLNVAFKLKEKSELVPDMHGLDINQLNERVKRASRALDLLPPVQIIFHSIKPIYSSWLEICKKFSNEENLELENLELYLEELEMGESVEIDDIKSTLKTIMDKVFNCSLEVNSFKKAVYRVKLVEHSIDKDKYPLNAKLLDDAYSSRTGTSEEKKLLRIIFGEDYVPELTEKQELEIARAELISVLHKVAKDNVDKNPTQYIKK